VREIRGDSPFQEQSPNYGDGDYGDVCNYSDGDAATVPNSVAANFLGDSPCGDSPPTTLTGTAGASQRQGGGLSLKGTVPGSDGSTWRAILPGSSL
jgi:hypothetical protein